MAVKDDNTIFIYKDVTAPKLQNPLKKANCISNITFVVIDKSLVKHFEINAENTWFEQEVTENGILLRIRRFW